MDLPLCSYRVEFADIVEAVTNKSAVDTEAFVLSVAAKLYVIDGRFSVTAIGGEYARPLPPFAAEDDARPR